MEIIGYATLKNINPAIVDIGEGIFSFQKETPYQFIKIDKDFIYVIPYGIGTLISIKFRIEDIENYFLCSLYKGLLIPPNLDQKQKESYYNNCDFKNNVDDLIKYKWDFINNKLQSKSPQN